MLDNALNAYNANIGRAYHKRFIYIDYIHLSCSFHFFMDNKALYKTFHHILDSQCLFWLESYKN